MSLSMSLLFVLPSLPVARRAVKTAGEAMGIDLRPKPTRVKHWPDAPAITDLWRSTDSTVSEGRTNNSDMDIDMEALSPTRRPPTRLKRGRRRNGEWGGSGGVGASASTSIPTSASTQTQTSSTPTSTSNSNLTSSSTSTSTSVSTTTYTTNNNNNSDNTNNNKT